MSISDAEIYYPKSAAHWRRWLDKNHDKKESVWVVFYRQSAQHPTLTWSEAVDEALCYGWIDSVKRPYDAERSIQFFSRRKPKSTWSRINKNKVERLIADGRMKEAGHASIHTARQNGSWEMLDAVEDLTIPADLKAALRKQRGATACFDSLSRSVKKLALHRLLMAKKPETRQKRIEEILTAAAEKQNAS